MGRKYYEEPTQVVFIENMEDDGSRKIGGIAYQDYIICGECGGVVKIEETEIVEELPWCAISEEIGGDEIY